MKIILFLLFPTLVFSQDFLCKIKGFIDGESGVLLIQVDSNVVEQTFRLVGIDCPERSVNTTEGQTFSLDAKKIMQDSFSGKIGRCFPVYPDNYQRTVMRIIIGSDLSHFAVQNGLAWAIEDKALTDTENLAFKTEMESAKKNKLGLWKFKAISPGRFRYKNRL